MESAFETVTTSSLMGVIVGVIMGIAGAFVTRSSYLKLRRRRRAEEKLWRMLQNDLEFRQFLRQRRNLLAHASERKLDEREAAELIRRIDEELAPFDEKDKESIREALHQRTTRGRSSYLEGLVEESVKSPTNIQETERVLRNAVDRGALDEHTVESAIERWRQADANLDDAHTAQHDREKKVAQALIEYNEATYLLTKLLNTVTG